MAKDFERFADALTTARGADGGYGPRAGLAPEPEPTALAAIALNDGGARGWLEEHQESDGSVSVMVGTVRNASVTALSALALEGDSRRRALEAVSVAKAGSVPSSAAVPFDADLRGWPWTDDAFGWVEPTSWAVLALRVALPEAAAEIERGVAVLRDRECMGGGWNYGNRIVLDETLPPFGQPTAIAMLALQAFDDDELWRRGLTALRQLWRQEASGGLTLAVASAALRANADADAASCFDALAGSFDQSGFLGDVVTLAWATIATGPGLERLRMPT